MKKLFFSLLCFFASIVSCSNDDSTNSKPEFIEVTAAELVAKGKIFESSKFISFNTETHLTVYFYKHNSTKIDTYRSYSYFISGREFHVSKTVNNQEVEYVGDICRINKPGSSLDGKIAIGNNKNEHNLPDDLLGYY